MSIFKRKPKYEPPKKLTMTLNKDTMFAEFRCPYCNALVHSEYYGTARVPDIKNCPSCQKELGHY